MTGLPDLQIILCLVYMTNAALSAVLASFGPKFRGARLWVVAQTLLALGTLADTLPRGVPSWIPLIAGNTCYAASCLCYAHSVWVFRFERRFPPCIYAIVAIQAASFALAFPMSYVIRALVFSAWMTAGSLITAVLLIWRADRRFWLSNGLTAFPFIVLGLSSLSRLFVIGMLSSGGEVTGDGTHNLWYVSGAILLSTIMLFGYFMMSWLQTTHILEAKDKALNEKNASLEDALRVKDTFIAVIAHDIRGPVGAAARFTRKRLVGAGKNSAIDPNHVETLAVSLEKTNEYLEKLLLWSKTQFRDWAPVAQNVSIDASVEEALAMFGSRLELKQLTIDLILKSTGLIVSADPESLRVILDNLLSNAVKYSHPGSKVSIEIRKDGDSCVVGIRDYGVGMPEATLKKLFLIEKKTSSLGTSSEMGSGLGLILAKSLADRNGCRLSIASEPGKGTLATLALPIART